MRDSITVSLCGVLVCAGLLMPACGSSGSKNDGPGGLGQDAGAGGRVSTGGAIGTGGLGLGGAVGTGGKSQAGGAVGTGGASASGGAVGTGGAAILDAGRDGQVDGPPAELDASLDQNPGSDTRDVPLERDAAIDGTAASIDTGNLDGGTAKVEAGADSTPAACAAAGGFCSRNRWSICPAHYEPAAEGTGHLDCPSSGWCCVPAPSSPCSDQGTGNCVVGTSCSGCWSSAPGAPSCENGRVCCVDICD